MKEEGGKRTDSCLRGNRKLLIRTTRNRLRGLPDPLTLKGAVSKDDPRLVLVPGEPVRTAVSTALVRKAHKVKIWMPRFPYSYEPRIVHGVDGPRLLPFAVNVDMPAIP